MNQDLRILIDRYPSLAEMAPNIDHAVDLLVQSFRSGGKLLLCGNGGSAADCDHIAGELLKGFRLRRRLSIAQASALAGDTRSPGGGDAGHQERIRRITAGLQQGVPAIPLPAFAAVGTAFANDVEPSLTFAQLVNALGRPGDILIAISTSGESENVVMAATTAAALGLTVVALTGSGGGTLGGYADCLLNVPATETYQVQELHLPVYHYICARIETELFGGDETVPS